MIVGYYPFRLSCDVEDELGYWAEKTSWKTVEVSLEWNEGEKKEKNEVGGWGVHWCYQVNLGAY